MQQDNNIEKKLQQLDNQQLPDLSQMDKHWEDMQVLMQPGMPGTQSGFNLTRILYVAVAVAIILGGVLFILNNKNGDSGNKETTVTITPEKNTALIKDSILVNQDTAVLVNNASRFKPTGYALTPLFHRVDTTGLAGLSEMPKTNDSIFRPASKEELFSQLFQQLSKPVQHFSIDDKKDTMLVCNEGTVLMVPAHSFAGEDSIDFEITEFYEYSDMVLNRLSTMSDSSQLISGGMVRINAYRNDSLVEVRLEKKLKIFIPGLTEKDSMLIFDGKENKETMRPADYRINWSVAGVRFNTPEIKMYVRAIDLRDDEWEEKHNIGTTNEKIIYQRAITSTLSKDDLRKLIREKYPDHTRIRIKKIWKRNLFFKKNDWNDVDWAGDAIGHSGVGDTTAFLPHLIARYKLTPIDTVYSSGAVSFNRWKNWKNWKLVTVTQENAISKNIFDKYNFEVSKLGWINCDRFYNYPGRKSDLYVKVEEEEKNYFTVLVFDRFKSVMNAYTSGKNKIGFTNIPAGEPAKIISIGINASGKTVLAIKEVFAGKQMEKLVYQEKNTEEIKNSLSILNK